MTTSAPPGPGAHWATIAARWATLGPPLRPSAEDLDVIDRALDRAGPCRRVLVLGATPDLGARWPGRTSLAVDHTPAMLRHLWSGGSGTASIGDWLALPVGGAMIDAVVCDGGLHLVDDRVGQQELLAEVARVLRPGGTLILRLFGRGPTGAVETVDDVLSDLARGAIPDAHCLKFRLWGALAGPDPAGTPVAVADVWAVMQAAHPELDLLSARLGWSPEGLRSFGSYAGAADRYLFTPFEDVVAWCTGPGRPFDVVELVDGPGPLGDACPTLIVRRRP